MTPAELDRRITEARAALAKARSKAARAVALQALMALMAQRDR